MTGARRPRHLQRTRSDILEATAAVVEEHGYGGSRVEDICARAGVSRGAFYHHFRSKDAAIVALLERGAMRMVEDALAMEARVVGDPPRRIALGMALVLRFVQAEGPFARAYWIDMQGVPELQDLRQRIDLAFEARMRLNLGPVFASGALISADPRATVQAIMGMSKELAVAWMQGRVPDMDTSLHELVRMVLTGVGVEPERVEALADEAVRYRPHA